MTVQSFYDQVGGTYEDVVRRLGNEALVMKVLGMLPRDGSMAALREAVTEKNYETAFRASHTLKGIAMNLGLARLTESAVELTDTLRAKVEDPRIPIQLERVERHYADVILALRELTGAQAKEGNDDA